MKVQQYTQALYEALENCSVEEQEKRLDNFVKLLKRNGHMRLAPRIVKSLEALLKKEEEEKTVWVMSAQEFTPSATKEIIRHESAELRDFGDKTIVKRKRDDSLIGGYVVETREERLDRSHKRQLLTLYRNMIR